MVVGDTVLVISIVVVADPVVVMTWVVGVAISEHAFEIKEHGQVYVKIVVEMITQPGMATALSSRSRRARLVVAVVVQVDDVDVLAVVLELVK